MTKETNSDNALQSKKQGNSLTNRENDMGFGLNPSNLNEAIKICEYMAGSSIVPKSYQGNPQDILVAINFGSEVGLKPLQSLNSVAVVNGTPSLYGDAPLGLVKQAPDFEYILEDNEGFAFARDNVNGWEHLKNINKNDTSICVVKRAGQPPTVREFSKEDVATAKLGNVHKSYPKTMRKYRARSRALRDAFPDVLKGLQQAEINEETEVMIEKGIYDDLNVKDEVKQPTERESIDIDMNADSQEEPDTSGDISADNQPADITPEGREEMMHEISEKARQHWGKDKYYGKIKTSVTRINQEAGNMLDLSDPELQTLWEGIMNMKPETQEA